MNGLEYEIACANYLKNRGFKNVEVTKSSGDQGIDVIAYKDDIKYGIQCKLYSQPVGNKAVQEAYSGSKFYECDAAIVFTNGVFTKSAQELAEKLDVQLWDNMTETVIKKRIRHVKLLFSDVLIIIGKGLSLFGILVSAVCLAFSVRYAWLELILFVLMYLVLYFYKRRFHKYNILKTYKDIFLKTDIDIGSIIKNKAVGVDELYEIIGIVRESRDNEQIWNRKLKNRYYSLDVRLCNWANSLMDKYYRKNPDVFVDENQYIKPEKRKI